MSKRIIVICVFVLLALLIGLVYSRVVLGSSYKHDTNETLSFLLNKFYWFGLLRLGSIIGGTIAILFITTEVVYLKKKFNIGLKSTFKRLLVLLSIAAVVILVHYVLEKIIDVI